MPTGFIDMRVELDVASLGGETVVSAASCAREFRKLAGRFDELGAHPDIALALNSLAKMFEDLG